MPTIERYELKNYLPLNTFDAKEKQLQGDNPIKPNDHASNIQRPRWRTKEFCFYYICIAVVAPYMIYTAMKISQPHHPNYNSYSHLLSDGWIFDRKVDNSDLQYASFRQQFPLLGFFAAIYIILSHLYKRIVVGSDSRKKRYFYLLSSIISLIALHGIHCIKIWLIITISYLINLLPKQKWGCIPILSWFFGILVLFLNEYYNLSLVLIHITSMTGKLMTALICGIRTRLRFP